MVQRDSIEQDLHVGQRRDGHTALAELPFGCSVIGVVAVESGHVEGHAQTRLTVLQQVLEALVGLLGSAVAREHAHGPQSPSITRGVHPSHIGKLARQSHIFKIIPVLLVARCVHRLHRYIGGGAEERVAHRLRCSALPPLRLRIAYARCFVRRRHGQHLLQLGWSGLGGIRFS